MKTGKFEFQENAENIAYEDLRFERYAGDQIDTLSKADLIRYIIDEAKHVQNERAGDLAELKGEHGNLEGFISQLSDEEKSLNQRAETIRMKQDEANQRLQNRQRQLESVQESTDDIDAQIENLNLMLKGQQEQKARDLKAVDEKWFAQLQKDLATKDGPNFTTFSYIAQNLNKCCAQEKQDTDLFASDLTTFKMILKKAAPENLDKDVLKEMGMRLNQGPDSSGEIYKRVSDQHQLNVMVYWFPMFKTLFKLVQIGLTIKKRANLLRKKAANDEKKRTIAMDVATEDTIAKDLGFCETISAEAERMRNGELSIIARKKAQIESKYNALNTDDDVFFQEYFRM